MKLRSHFVNQYKGKTKTKRKDCEGQKVKQP